MRKLRSEELTLIKAMAKGTSVENVVLAKLDDSEVVDLADGGMEIIRFVSEQGRLKSFGRKVAEFLYKDEDDIPVSLALNFDNDGGLFELDIFKADESTLVKYPDPGEIEPAVP
jgi:hypothetical protein